MRQPVAQQLDKIHVLVHMRTSFVTSSGVGVLGRIRYWGSIERAFLYIVKV